eukprot:575443-Amphidinium_carterae.1
MPKTQTLQKSVIVSQTSTCLDYMLSDLVTYHANWQFPTTPAHSPSRKDAPSHAIWQNESALATSVAFDFLGGYTFGDTCDSGFGCQKRGWGIVKTQT